MAGVGGVQVEGSCRLSDMQGMGAGTGGIGWEGDTDPVKLSRLAAAGGHSAAEVQLSGLAAEDARDPQIMMVGFVLLGAGTVVFGAGLGRVAAPRSAGPWLVLAAGAAERDPQAG